MRLRSAFFHALLVVACSSESATQTPDGGAITQADAGPGDAAADVQARDVVRECPTTQPEAGVSCSSDLAFLDCSYPEADDAGASCHRACQCGGQEHFSWYCEETLDCL